MNVINENIVDSVPKDNIANAPLPPFIGSELLLNVNDLLSDDDMDDDASTASTRSLGDILQDAIDILQETMVKKDDENNDDELMNNQETIETSANESNTNSGNLHHGETFSPPVNWQQQQPQPQPLERFAAQLTIE